MYCSHTNGWNSFKHVYKLDTFIFSNYSNFLFVYVINFIYSQSQNIKAIRKEELDAIFC